MLILPVEGWFERPPSLPQLCSNPVVVSHNLCMCVCVQSKRSSACDKSTCMYHCHGDAFLLLTHACCCLLAGVSCICSLTVAPYPALLLLHQLSHPCTTHTPGTLCNHAPLAGLSHMSSDVTQAAAGGLKRRVQVGVELSASKVMKTEAKQESNLTPLPTPPTPFQ